MAINEPRMLKMAINYFEVSFPEGVSVLRAAELNGIYIPSLCYHKDLTPFGSCRMCMVEIEGMRGYPLACDTKAAAGMKVLTDTVRLRELRREVLKLILSEHPSSCLVCDDKVECRDWQGTIRKTGVTTGCRYCPNDNDCELQTLVEAVGVTDIDFPIYYHSYEPEKSDPFYDRDYNICILCGRCVRMCQEVRGTSVLAFTHRGPKAKIGPAFGRNHMEAGCEFCGACVDVCPTGALADKVSKWDGKSDGTVESTCPFCPVGCQIEIRHRNGMLSCVRPSHADPNDGQLCLRGRFSLPEMTHHHSRMRKPMLRKGQYFREVEWDEALAVAAEKLGSVNPDKFLMLVSPDLTAESMHAARRFVHEQFRSGGIDSASARTLSGGPAVLDYLMSLPVSLQAIRRADLILTVGYDSRFHHSVVGVEVRKALNKGARLVNVDCRNGNMATYSEAWVRTRPGLEGTVLRYLAQVASGSEEGLHPEALDCDPEDLALASGMVTRADDIVVILGPGQFAYSGLRELLEGIDLFARRPSSHIIPLYEGTNTRSLVELKLMPELAGTQGMSFKDLEAGAKPDVLYLVGETPTASRPNAGFIIAQDNYLPPFEVDLFLPAASYSEAGGTVLDLEGVPRRIAGFENFPPGTISCKSMPDWLIFDQIACQLGGGFGFASEEDVLRDLVASGGDCFAEKLPQPAVKKLPQTAPATSHEGLALVIRPGAFKHRGTDMAAKVEGLAILGVEKGIRLSPGDAGRLGLAGSADALLMVNGKEIRLPATVDPDVLDGTAFVSLPLVWGGVPEWKGALADIAATPVSVTVRPA